MRAENRPSLNSWLYAQSQDPIYFISNNLREGFGVSLLREKMSQTFGKKSTYWIGKPAGNRAVSEPYSK